MTMRVPAAVSSRKQDWPYQVSLPAGAAGARVRRQARTTAAPSRAARSEAGAHEAAMIAPRAARYGSR